MELQRLTSPDDLARSFPLMHELRDHLTLDTYLKLLETMTAEGYELWALCDGDDIKALAGIALRTNLYYGRYISGYSISSRPRANAPEDTARLS